MIIFQQGKKLRNNATQKQLEVILHRQSRSEAQQKHLWLAQTHHLDKETVGLAMASTGVMSVDDI